MFINSNLIYSKSKSYTQTWIGDGNKLRVVYQPIQRSTLIAGIFALSSFLLCCLSGAIGWFNAYFGLTVAITAGCFFLLVACSTGLSFLRNCGGQDTSNDKNRLVTIICIVCSILVLVIAHVFIITRNVSPSENLLGNHDQGMYLAAASHLKTEGSHSMATDWISQSSASYKRFLTKEISPSLKTGSPVSITNTGTQAGFYLINDNGSSQYIQFPPGYPTLLAIFWNLGNYDLVARSNVIICLLSGLMLAAVCRNFIGRSGALSTWLLFLFCPLTIWSANHLYAEPTLLLLWLTALWALGFSKEYPLLSALMAALSIGIAFAVKIDALPLFVLPFVYAAFINKDNSLRFRAVFLILSIATYALSTVFYIYYSRPYLEFTLSGLLSGRLFVVTVCTLLLVAMIFSIITIRFGERTRVKTNPQLLRYGLAVLIGIILVYFYFVRPQIAEPHRLVYNEFDKAIESLREQTFYRLGWYFTPLGLALASTGLTLSFIKRIHTTQMAFTGMAALFLIYYSYDIHCMPYQPYAMRRFFPFVVPALCFSIPFLIQNIPAKKYSSVTKIGLITIITTVLLGQFQQINRKLILRDDYRGLYQYLSSVSRKLPEERLILINGKGKARIYVAPLRYIFGQECILFYPDYRAREFHEMIRHFAKDNKGSVYMLATSLNNSTRLRVQVIATQTLQTMYSGIETNYPEKDIKHANLSLYLVEVKIP